MTKQKLSIDDEVPTETTREPRKGAGKERTNIAGPKATARGRGKRDNPQEGEVSIDE